MNILLTLILFVVSQCEGTDCPSPDADPEPVVDRTMEHLESDCDQVRREVRLSEATGGPHFELPPVCKWFYEQQSPRTAGKEE